MVRFDQTIVNGSEGNVAVICVTALFPPSEGRLDMNQEVFTINLSVVGQGSAGMYNTTHIRQMLSMPLIIFASLCSLSKTDTSDYAPLQPNISFSLNNNRQCVRISITNDSIPEGTETFIVELSHGNNSQSIVRNNAILIPMETNRTIVQITDVCYDGEVRLRGGFDKNQGRVEVCYNGTWGTVCDNGLRVAQVVCKQLGLEFQSKHTD